MKGLSLKHLEQKEQPESSSKPGLIINRVMVIVTALLLKYEDNM